MTDGWLLLELIGALDIKVEHARMHADAVCYEQLAELACLFHSQEAYNGLNQSSEQPQSTAIEALDYGVTGIRYSKKGSRLGNKALGTTAPAANH